MFEMVMERSPHLAILLSNRIYFMISKYLSTGGIALVLSIGAVNAAVILLNSNTSSIALNNSSQYLTIDNPLVAGGAVSDTAGSLFFATTVARGSASGFSTIGIYATNDGASTAGGVDIGRNNASGSFSIFDYLDNKGQGSAIAQVAGSPMVNLGTGTYKMIAEIEFTSANAGIIRGWVIDGVSGAFDINSPNVTTTFSAGFNGSPSDLYLKANTGIAATYSGTSAVWAETTADRSAAFASVIPEPSSLAFAALGMLGLARRKRSVAAAN